MRSPISTLTLVVNRETGHIEVSCTNLVKMEALQVVQRFQIQLTNSIIEESNNRDVEAVPEDAPGFI